MNVLERLARHGPPSGGTLLLLGRAARHAEAAHAAGWNPRVATAEPGFGVRPGECAAALAEDAVARDPWDRWLLQRVHRALAPGGLLVAFEPNQTDLSTPSGVAYVGSRALRLAARGLRRRLRPAEVPGPSFVGRRPSHRTLDVVLRSLRFERLEAWTERGGPWGGLLPEAFGARIGVVARALPSLAGLDDSWPEEAAHRRAYETAQGAMLATRRRWAAAHPGWVSDAPTDFEPAAFAGRGVLVLAPHPDDEVIGAGGTLVALARAGARIVCVQATDGSAGAALARTPFPERREARLREAMAVSRAAGFADLQLWRADNGDFRETPELAARLAALLAKEQPAIVFVPFVTEAHADHLTLAALLARALGQVTLPEDARVFGYEVWSLVPANVVHEVTPLVRDLESLLFLYDIAMRIDDFVHFCADRGLYHAWHYRGRPAYLEAFHAVKAADYPALLRTVRPGTE